MEKGSPRTYQQILSAGKKEFLEKGYDGASMRQIALSAGVTTGAIYGYFKDKAALFNALVETVAEEAILILKKIQGGFRIQSFETDEEIFQNYLSRSKNEFISYIYDHLDEFKLIINAPAAAGCYHYLDDLITLEVDYISAFIGVIGTAREIIPLVEKDVVQILCNTLFQGVFQIVNDNLPKTVAEQHIDTISVFYRGGWNHLFSI